MYQMLALLIVLLLQRNSATTMNFDQAEKLLSKYDALISAISAKSASTATATTHSLQIPPSITAFYLPQTHFTGHLLAQEGDKLKDIEFDAVVAAGNKITSMTVKTLYETKLSVAPTVTVTVQAHSEPTATSKPKKNKSRKSKKRKDAKHATTKCPMKESYPENSVDSKSARRNQAPVHQQTVSQKKNAAKRKKQKQKVKNSANEKHGLVVTNNEIVVVNSDDDDEAEDLLVTESEIEVLEAIKEENPRSKAKKIKTKSKINRRARKLKNRIENGPKPSFNGHSRKKMRKEKLVKEKKSSDGCLDQLTEYIGNGRRQAVSSMASRRAETNIVDVITKIADVVKTANPIPNLNPGACCMNYAETRTKTLTQVSVIPIHHTEFRKQTNTIVVPKTIIVTNVKYEPYPVTKTEVDTMYMIKPTVGQGCGCELGSNGMLLPGGQLPPGIFATPVNEVDRSKYDIIGYAGQKAFENIKNGYNAPQPTRLY